VFWVISVYFNIRNTLPKSGTFLLGHPVYIAGVNVQQFHYRPGQALRVLGGSVSQISRQSSHEGDKVVKPIHWLPLLPQEMFLVLISVRG